MTNLPTGAADAQDGGPEMPPEIDPQTAHEIGQSVLDGVAGFRMGDAIYGVSTALACMIGGAYALHAKTTDDALEAAHEVYQFICDHIKENYGGIELIEPADAILSAQGEPR